MWKRADELVERLSAALPMAAASVSRPDRNVKTTWGSVHSLPGQRFTRHFLLIPWRGRFLRFRDHIGQARHGRLRHPVVAPDPMMQAESPGGQDRKASGARHLDLVRWLDDESHAPIVPPWIPVNTRPSSATFASSAFRHFFVFSTSGHRPFKTRRQRNRCQRSVGIPTPEDAIETGQHLVLPGKLA